MNLIDNYLYQVRKYLPLKDRDEIIKELKSHILDQVDENDDTMIEDVLKEMGHPRDTARKYRGNTGLLSKELEPLLELIIKLISVLLPLLLIFVKLIEFLANNSDFTTMDLLLNLVYQIPMIISTLFSGIGVVFLIFVLIERYIQPRFNVDQLPFDPKTLPDVPTKEYKTSLIGNLFGLMITAGFLYIINLEPGLIAIYYEGTRLPLLNEQFNTVLVLMNIGLFIAIGIYAFHAFKRRKTGVSKVLEIAHGYYSAVVIIYIATSDIFNLEFIENFGLTIVPKIITIALIFVGVAAIIGHTVELFKVLVFVPNETKKNTTSE